MGVLNRIVPGDGDPRHGSNAGYVDHGCRCPACTAAGRAYALESRARRRAEWLAGKRDFTHGTLNGRNVYGCTCPACETAMKAETARRAMIRRVHRQAQANGAGAAPADEGAGAETGDVRRR